MNNVSQHYINRIDKALSFIVQSLSADQEPDLATIASHACLSKFHFHRVYRLVTGETCQQTIERIKLAIATNSLANESVTMAAMNAHYSSSQSLAKALKRSTGFTASELKQDKEKLSATLTQLSLPSTNNDSLITVELTQLSPIQYIAHRTNLPYESLNTIYEQLFVQAGGPDNVAAIIGRSNGNQPWLNSEQAEFECGLVLNNSDTHKLMSLPDGHYVRIRHLGSFEQLDESIDELYKVLLCQQEIKVGDSEILFHYLDDPEEVAEPALRTDIYLMVTTAG